MRVTCDELFKMAQRYQSGRYVAATGQFGRLRTTAVRGRRRAQLIGIDGEAIATAWCEQMTPDELKGFLGTNKRGW